MGRLTEELIIIIILRVPIRLTPVPALSVSVAQYTLSMLCFTQRTLLSWPLAEKVNDELISVLNS